MRNETYREYGNVIEILKIHGKKSILLDKFNADIFHVRGSGLFIC